MGEPALEAHRISMSFGGLRALCGVDAAFWPGEVHAVLGENGAGKSTLMNILAGFLVPDAGSVECFGRPAPMGSAKAMRGVGASLVHQHFMLVPEFSVLENLALDQLTSLGGLVEMEDVRSRALSCAKDVGWTFDLDSRTGSLPVGVQQRIEILKALIHGTRILILDEPTAVLSPGESAELFDVLGRLRDAGCAIILIAHKLSEVFAIADRVTVLRRGEVTGAALIKDVNAGIVAKWMVGERIDAATVPNPALGEVRLRVDGLSVHGDRGETSVRDVSFQVSCGEIFGIAGVDGNGQLELAEAVVGMRDRSGGQIQVEGKVAYIPQDRRRDGLALDMSIWENLVDAQSPLKWLVPHKERARAEVLRARFGIKAQSVTEPPRQLSGGNQQKVVAARELGREPDVIVAMNPTRGLDLNAADFVHAQLREAARRGAAVLLISTDFDEIATLAHRFMNISRGRLTEGGVEAFLGAPT